MKSRTHSNKICKNCNTDYFGHFNSQYCSTLCQQRKWKSNNLDKARQLQRDWRAKNPDAVLKDARSKTHADAVKKWKQNNIKRKREYENNYDKERKKKDIGYRLSSNLRSRLAHAISGRKKWASAIRHLGCSIEDFKKHLEFQFAEGMSWDNYGSWHIDHIKPLAGYDLSDPDELKKACHFTNLQPLWAKENMSKGGKI